VVDDGVGDRAICKRRLMKTFWDRASALLGERAA
jgi:hypothetical protein